MPEPPTKLKQAPFTEKHPVVKSMPFEKVEVAVEETERELALTPPLNDPATDEPVIVEPEIVTELN